jgi:hypothetical protein
MEIAPTVISPILSPRVIYNEIIFVDVAIVYGLLSFVYLEIPGRGILGLPWNAVAKLLEFSQGGTTRSGEKTEEALKEIENGLRLVHPYLPKGLRF